VFIKIPAFVIFLGLLALHGILIRVSEHKRPRLNLSADANRALWNPVSNEWRKSLDSEKAIYILAERGRRMLHLLAMTTMSLMFFLSYQLYQCALQIEMLRK